MVSIELGVGYGEYRDRDIYQLPVTMIPAREEKDWLADTRLHTWAKSLALTLL